MAMAMIMSGCHYRVDIDTEDIFTNYTALRFASYHILSYLLVSYPILSYPFLCLIPCDVTLLGPEAAASSEPREVHGGGDEGLGAEAADRQGCPDTGGEGEERHRQVTRIKQEKRREEEEEKRREGRFSPPLLLSFTLDSATADFDVLCIHRRTAF